MATNHLKKVTFNINRRKVQISIMTSSNPFGLNKKEREEFNKEFFTLIKDKEVKLLLINLAMHFYEDYREYFIHTNEVVPFSKRKNIIKRESIRAVPTYPYFELLTKHLDEDWYVSFHHKFKKERIAQTNFPYMDIYTKSTFERIDKSCKSFKNNARKLLKEYREKNYNFNYDEKTKKLKGNVILLGGTGFIFNEVFGLPFVVINLLTNSFLDYAYFKETENYYLKPGIYKIEANYLKKGFGYYRQGFVIKKAKLIKELKEKSSIYNENLIPITDYKWSFKTDLISFFYKFIKKPSIIIKNKLIIFLNILIYILIALVIIGSFFYWIYDIFLK